MANSQFAIQVHLQSIQVEAVKLWTSYPNRNYMQHQPEAVKLWEEQYRTYCLQFGLNEWELDELENEIKHIKELVRDMFQFPATFIV